MEGGELVTDKQKIFANEYLIDLNATRAYMAAYPNTKNENTAAVSANKLLRNAKIQEYISKRMKEREIRTEVTQDRILEEIANIAFYQVSDYVDVVGGQVIVKDTKPLKSNQLKAIAGIKEGANGIEIKLNDKLKALELLGRHTGLWNDKLNINVGNVDESSKKIEEYFARQKDANS